HGTEMAEDRSSAGVSTSGIRFRKTRLTAPMKALKANKAANCQGCGLPARHEAPSKKQPKLARLTHPASRERYLPRIGAGTSEVIQGSHAQLEIPRERLKAKRSRRISARRLVGFRNTCVIGTSAIPKMNITRIPQP